MPTQKEYRDLFFAMNPRFFENDYIRSIPPAYVYEEMILPLRTFEENALPIPVPDGITFGFYRGDMEELRDAVAAVDDGWVRYYGTPERAFCAMDGHRVVSFCLVDSMGEHEFLGQRVRIGGPGCVGTRPEYRRRGIGLRMVQLATGILKDEGYDYSYIHYTGVGSWYARLGYETTVRWNSGGFVD